MGRTKICGLFTLAVVMYLIISMPIILVLAHPAFGYHIADTNEIANMKWLTNPQSETIVYSHGRWWCLNVKDDLRDIDLYNSTDLVNWFGSTIEGTNEILGHENSQWRALASCLDSEGDLHIAWTDDQAGHNGWYKKVELGSLGNITSHASVNLGAGKYIEDIVVDSSDYPVILLAEGGVAKIEGSTTKNGLWNEDYSISMTNTTFKIDFGTLAAIDGKDIIIVGEGFDVATGGTALCSFYFHELTEVLSPPTVIYKFTNGAYMWDWYARPTLVDKEYTNANETFFSFGADWNGGVDRELRAYHTTDGGATWEYRVIYDNMPAGTDYVGHVSKLISASGTDSYYCIYKHNDYYLGNMTFFYSRISEDDIANFAVGAWSEWNITVYGSAADLWTGYQEGRHGFSMCQSYCAWNVLQPVFGHVQHDAADDVCIHTYNETFFDQPTPPPPPPIDTENITITNMEGCGNWVFEGRKQYDFFGNFSSSYGGANISAGVGFFDYTNRWYSVWFNAITNQTTLTSPDDGISGVTYSRTIVANISLFHWYISFNPTIADTLDVNLYGRGMAGPGGVNDTGWVVHQTAYFNIYNLGGFSNLTTDGWAGRIAGGDVFEIYAADTRAPIMFDESFERELEARDVSAWWAPMGLTQMYPKALPWLVIDDPPYSNITVTETYPNTNSLPYAYLGPKNFPTWRDGYRSLHMDTQNFSDYMPYAVRRFRRPLTQAGTEEMYLTFFIQTPQNYTDPATWGAVARFKLSDIPTYMTGSVTTTEFFFDDLGRVWHIRAGGTDIVGIGGVPVIVQPDTWYNMTIVVTMGANQVDLYWDTVLTNITNRPFLNNGTIEYFTIILQNGFIGPPWAPSEFYIDAIHCWTDFDEPWGGWAEATTLHNMLQHWHMDFDINVEDGYVAEPFANFGYVELGWDICLNDTWENNFLVARVNITKADIPGGATATQAFLESLQDLFTGEANWVRFNVTWTQNGTFIKQDVLYGLYEGYDIGITEGGKDDMGFHWDIWFNSMNASTVVGGRINCEWFGMHNKAPSWQIWTSKWRPMIEEVTDSTCFVNLIDSTAYHNLHSAKEVELVRSWVYVWRNNESTFHYMVKNIEGMDFRCAKETMIGVDTPPITKTLAPITGQGFFGSMLGAMFKRVMMNFANQITMGAMMMWTWFVGFMDTIFAYFGLPGFFSTVTNLIGSFFSFFTTSTGYLLTLITQIFGFFTASVGFILSMFTGVVSTFLQIISIVVAILNGTHAISTGLGNIWILLNFSDWSSVVPVLLIVAWFVSLDNRAREAGGGWMGFFLGDLQSIMGLISWLLDVFLRIMNFVLGIIFDIINAIPIVE